MSSLPPPQWACAPTGSLGPKNNLIYLSLLVLALLGTSSDIPIVWCTPNTMSANIFRRKTLSTIIVNQCTMSNQQRTPSRRAQQASTRIALLCQTFENFTVVASALVAEFGRRARLKPGCPTRACRFKSCRAHFVSRACSPIGRGTGFRDRSVWVRVLLGAPRVVGEIAYHSWLLPMSSGFESRATQSGAVS